MTPVPETLRLAANLLNLAASRFEHGEDTQGLGCVEMAGDLLADANTALSARVAS